MGHAAEQMQRVGFVALAALATLTACTGAGPLHPDPGKDTGAAGSVAPKPPSPATGGGGTGGPSAGASGYAGTRGGAAGTVGAAAGTVGTDAGTASPDAGTVGTDAGTIGTDAGTIGTDAGRAGLASATIPDFEPVAISAAGLVVAGVHKNNAASWTAMTGVRNFPVAGVDVISSTVVAMNREGTVFVGALQKATTSQAAFWAGNVYTLGFARDGDDSSRAVACSGDGKTIVGTSENTFGVVGLRQQAFIWRAGSGLTTVPLMTGDGGSEALAVSQDGSTVIGFSYDGATSPPRRRAFWWRDGEITVEIAPAPGAALMVPRALSADGSVVVGDAVFGVAPTADGTTSVSRAFRWTFTHGVELAAERGDRDQSRAVGVSLDGGTVTGLFFTNGMWKDLPIPFRWQPPSATLLTAPPDDLPVPDIFIDELGTTIVGLGRIYVSSTAFLWRPGFQGYQPLPLGPMPGESVGVALSGNGSVLLGRGRGATASQVDAWLLPLP